MNTPSHWLFNLVLLGRDATPATRWAIAAGAILPDLPIFVLYAASKGIYRLPEAQIWRETYYEPGWQAAVAIGHSLPLAGVGLLVSFWCRWHLGTVLCASLICHSLLDLPVHHDDAHRHFFPLSDFRFVSPLSYWDTDHYGRWVAGCEVLGAIALTPLVLEMYRSWAMRGLIFAIDSFYVIGYISLYFLPLFRR